ncbi:dephospho-CoA kinase [uncultured Olsenella sp.]|uniref:dephospho-CoA kinase n=1 Tax=uncultured Olsenella sp. TaxID=190764 RepID=UPI0026DBD80E|nr:dephospho-CoA kinase [uncultured Olsenella sp.]
MYVVFLAGGIASGKSTVARLLAARGARVIDLDQLSRDVLAPGEPCLAEVAATFGADLLDPVTGELDRRLLAHRAFATPEGTSRLEAIELPHIKSRLGRLLDEARAEAAPPTCVVVEVSLLDRVQDLLALTDEVLVVSCPAPTRLERAVTRGMGRADAAARMALQPTDEYLSAHCDVELANDSDEEGLAAKVDAWWAEHVSRSWAPAPRRGGPDAPRALL